MTCAHVPHCSTIFHVVLIVVRRSLGRVIPCWLAEGKSITKFAAVVVHDLQSNLNLNLFL